MDVGSLLQAVLPGVAAIATRKPSVVGNTIGTLEAGKRSGETANIKRFGMEALRLGREASPEAVLQLAVKHQVNPQVALQYMQKFHEWRRSKKTARLDELQLAGAERNEQTAVNRDDFLNSIMGMTPVNTANYPDRELSEASTVNVQNLMGKGMKAGYLPAQVESVFEVLGLEKPEKKEKAKLQKIDTVSADGKPVFKFIPEDQVVGQEFPKYVEPKEPKDTDKGDIEIRMKKLNAFAKLRGFSEFSKLDEDTSTKVTQDVINFEKLVTAGQDFFEAMKEARSMTDRQFTGTKTVTEIPAPAMTEKVPILGGLMGNKDQAIAKSKEAFQFKATDAEVKAGLIEKGWSEQDAADIIARAKGGAAAATVPAAQGTAPALPTATNPQTGEKLAFKDGRWQPLQ